MLNSGATGCGGITSVSAGAKVNIPVAAGDKSRATTRVGSTGLASTGAGAGAAATCDMFSSDAAGSFGGVLTNSGLLTGVATGVGKAGGVTRRGVTSSRGAVAIGVLAKVGAAVFAFATTGSCAATTGFAGSLTTGCRTTSGSAAANVNISVADGDSSRATTRVGSTALGVTIATCGGLTCRNAEP